AKPNITLWKPASPLIELVPDVPRRSKPVFPGRVEHQLDQQRGRQTSRPNQTSHYGSRLVRSSSWCPTFPGEASRCSLGGSSTSSTNGGAGRLGQTKHHTMEAG